MDSTFNVASIFAGAAGLDLGLHRAIPGARTVVYVEREAYAVDLLATRMEEGALASAPIWTDARTFDGIDWRGLVDCVAGGSPCQDLSVAGKRAGLNGERSGLFFEFVRIVNEIRPRFVFWENVKGAIKYMPQVCAEFERIGYCGAWTCVRASDVGAPHQRERVFLLATDSQCHELREQSGRGSGANGQGVPIAREHGTAGNVAYAEGVGRREGRPKPAGEQGGLGIACGGSPLAHTDGHGEPQQGGGESVGGGWIGDRRVQANPWAVEPEVGRVAHGVANRVDRLRMLGNGVVPQQAALAWRILFNEVTK